MRLKTLFGSAFFSVLALVGISLAFEMPDLGSALEPADAIGAIISGYIVFIGVVVAIFMMFDWLLVRKLERHGMEPFLGGPKTHGTLMVMGLLLLIAGSYVTIPAGVIMIIAALIFVMIFFTIVQAIVIYVETHEPEEQAVRSIIKRGKGGRKEVRIREKEEMEEKEEQETIVEIFNLLKEKPDVRQTVTTAIQEGIREEGKPVDLISELRDMYKESKGEKIKDEVAEKLEAAAKLSAEAKAAAKVTEEEIIAEDFHLIQKTIKKVTKALRKEKGAEIVEKEKELNIVQESIQVTNKYINHTEEILKGLESKPSEDRDEKNIEVHKHLLSGLNRFDSLLRKLAKELEIEIKLEKREERLEKKEKRGIKEVGKEEAKKTEEELKTEQKTLKKIE